MKKLLLMVMVLALAGVAFGAVKAHKSYDTDVGAWDTFDGDNFSWSNHPGSGGSITLAGAGNGISFPGGSSECAGCAEFIPPASIFHWDSRSSGEKLFSTNEERTWEVWISPHWAGLGAGGMGQLGGEYGGALLILDGNGIWYNGNLFFYSNGAAGMAGYQLFFNSSLTGTIENYAVGNTYNWAIGSWHHVCISWDATHFMVGLDGNVLGRIAHEGLGSWSWGADAGGYMMGMDTGAGWGQYGWDGWVDEIMVSDTGHYAQYTSTYPVPTPCGGGPVLTCLDVWVQGYGFGADFNEDCHIDLQDMLQLSAEWLRCFDPCDGDCEKTWVQRP